MTTEILTNTASVTTSLQAVLLPNVQGNKKKSVNCLQFLFMQIAFSFLKKFWKWTELKSFCTPATFTWQTEALNYCWDRVCVLPLSPASLLVLPQPVEYRGALSLGSPPSPVPSTLTGQQGEWEAVRDVIKGQTTYCQIDFNRFSD